MSDLRQNKLSETPSGWLSSTKQKIKGVDETVEKLNPSALQVRI